MLHSPIRPKRCRRENSTPAPSGFGASRSRHLAAAKVRRIARIPNTSQVRQTLGNTSNVLSPPARRFPGPGCLGTKASVQLRHEEPASEDSQLPSVRRVDESAVKVSQSAGGASSLKTLASIVFGPVRKNFDTSSVETCFQVRAGTVSTVSPFIFNSIRLAAPTSNQADRGCESSVNVRRKVASIVATGCVRASTAVGNKIHSARPSSGRKLIFGSRSHFHASQPQATMAVATRAIAVQNVFNGKNLVAADARKNACLEGFEPPTC